MILSNIEIAHMLEFHFIKYTGCLKNGPSRGKFKSTITIAVRKKTILQLKYLFHSYLFHNIKKKNISLHWNMFLVVSFTDKEI